MSIPSVVHVFESGINAAPTSSLEALVRRQLEIAARDVAMTAAAPASTPPVHPKTLISDMGDYLTQAARVWSRLTDNLVHGSHVEMAAVEAHEQSRQRNHVSELSPIVVMDLEIRRLCKIRDLTEKFSRDVQDIWLPVPPASPDSPMQQTAFSSFEMKRTPLTRPSVAASEIETRVHGSQKALPSSQVSPGHPSPGDNASMSDDSEEDEDEQFARIDMEALKQRGKGSYYCPLGHRCDKGGVDKDGNLVLFDRNSSFAYACHLAHPAYLDPLETFIIS
ncbi:hypothetical protein G7Z17_g13609 [Cylindrodendrum hubeiense]|uniref:Uncharacterized protein n=1 Tax=Cylindrodendrum hubeiense TaxID=595255 RepID=A0A9P5L9E1_9HYPO|nr:hypothetical protein G7Z17_g13609 [Cylindrodendrum hubeiense]